MRRSRRLQGPARDDWAATVDCVDSMPMARSESVTKSQPDPRGELNDWIHGDPPLDEHSTHLLTAYREALSLANAQENTEQIADQATDREISQENAQAELDLSVTSGESDSNTSDESNNSSGKPAAKPRAVTSVPRIEQAEGIEPEQLARLHGRLIAMGYLAEELIGRTGGLVYRVTRDGIRRLNQEEISDAA